MGPIEVRSRTLALETSGCAHVQRYMSALSRRGELQGQDCASMDGAQAFSLTMCSKRVRLADATYMTADGCTAESAAFTESSFAVN